MTPAYVRNLNGITQEYLIDLHISFLCPVSANVYNIQFLKFRIRDMDSGQTLFEVERDQDEESIGKLYIDLL